MKSWAWAAVGLLAGAGMVGNAACGSSKGGTGGSTGSGGSGGSVSTVNPTQSTTSTGTGMDCGDLSFNDPTCTTCADTSCCSEVKACDTTSQCYALLQCEAAQMPNCETTYPDGVKPLGALNTCLTKSCATPCGITNTCTGDLVDWDSAFGTMGQFTACTQCDQMSCCSEFTSVTTDLQGCPMSGDCPANDALNACINGTDSTGCTGNEKAAIVCQNTNCSDQCFAGVCDAGIIGGTACATCEGMNCCADFEAMDCAMQGADCQPHLDAFNDCIMNGVMSTLCAADPVAVTAFNCVDTSCTSECMTGGGGGGGGGP